MKKVKFLEGHYNGCKFLIEGSTIKEALIDRDTLDGAKWLYVFELKTSEAAGGHQLLLLITGVTQRTVTVCVYIGNISHVLKLERRHFVFNAETTEP